MARPLIGVETTGAFTAQQYTSQQRFARASAEVVMPLVLRHTGARSVVDVGCGTGIWLSVCAGLGVTDYLGLDAASAAPQLEIPPAHFQAADLRRPLGLPRQFDLAMSLEVAEHLPAEAGSQLVEQLTMLAPQVLFSAAVPGQGGAGHINERWPSAWAAEFARHGYVAADVIRPQIWSDRRIAYWYRQNLLLFVRSDRAAAHHPSATMLDVAHPELYTQLLANIEGTWRARMVRLGRRLGVIPQR